VTDLGNASDPASPDLARWTEARNAWFVIDSGFQGGMGAAEPLPFASEAVARSFAATHGGSVKRFEEVPDSYILASPLDDGEGPLDETGEHGAHPRSTP